MKKLNLIVVGIFLAIVVLISGVFWYVNYGQKFKVQTGAEKLVNNNQQQNQGEEEENGQDKEGSDYNLAEEQNILELKIDNAERKNLFDAFMKYLKNNNQKLFDVYKNKKLHTSTGFIKNINGREYLKTMIWIKGEHSSPYILAVKQNKNWVVVFRGQDHPPCELMDEYNIPDEVYDTCFDKNNNLRCTVNSKTCY